VDRHKARTKHATCRWCHWTSNILNKI
jgi:hypothetical protein